MSTSTAESSRAGIGATAGGWRMNPTDIWWLQHREAARNWLALGLLLAAWNASDDAAAPMSRRPAALRGYSVVSVRAATLHPSGDARYR